MGKTTVDQGMSWDLSRAQVSQLILKPVFVSDNVFNSTFKVMPRVKDKARMYFLGAPSKFIQNNNNCDFTPKGTLPLTVREIGVQRKKIELQQCKDEVFDSCLEAALTGEGNAIFEPGATPEDNMLQKAMATQVANGIANDLFLLASFAKPGLTIGIPGSTDFYEVDDTLSQGLFPNLDQDVTDGRLTQLASGSGSALPANGAILLFQALWANRSLAFRGLEAALNMHELHVTQDVADNYRDYLESLGTVQEYSILVDGIQRLTWRGVVIIPHPEWDAEFKNPLVFNLTEQHRALLTVAGNMRVATDLSASDVALRIYTDVHMKNIYVQGNLRFGGARLAFPELAVYAA